MSGRTFVLWSIAAFLAPLGFAVYFNIWSSVIILVAVIVASLIYHGQAERKLLRVDTALAWILILSNLRLCYLGNFSFPYFPLALATASLALAFYFKKGHSPKSHAAWHVLSALVTLFSILSAPT